MEKRSILGTPIFHKLYELYTLFHSYQSLIPKSQRFSLWLRCENTILTLLETVIETGHKGDKEKLRSLIFMSDKLDILKVLCRLAKDTRTIDSKQYLSIQALIQEIGKMLGGWIKSVKSVSPMSQGLKGEAV